MNTARRLKVAILTGGDVAERVISLQSARTVADHLDPERYDTRIIDLRGGAFYDQATGLPLDKNDFSLPLEGVRHTFDLVFLMLHGHPAEDGAIHGYFELVGVPVTGCDHLCSALTFNKQACKAFLAPWQIPMAQGRLLRYDERPPDEELLRLGLPLFVKPNKNGSSFGVSKVTRADALDEAIELAFRYDDEVLVEQFIPGQEYSCGVVRRDGEVVVLPVTEIRPHTEFFDYQAKYESKSDEITPAPLPAALTEQIQALSRKCYEVLGCRGIVRFDFILSDGAFYFLEANTIPGMSPRSIVPQQARAHGWSLNELFEAVIREAMA